MIHDISDWPADLRDQYAERVAIKSAEGITGPESEAEALADTWAQRDRVHSVAHDVYRL